MYYIIIDCGTTNSRAYVVDAVGTVLGLAKKTVGVKDTSVTGSRDTLRSGLREIIARAIELAGLQPSQIAACAPRQPCGINPASIAADATSARR